MLEENRVLLIIWAKADVQACFDSSIRDAKIYAVFVASRNVGFLKCCRISSDYEQYRSLLSDFNISDGDATGMSYVVIDTGRFSRQVHFH